MKEKTNTETLVAQLALCEVFIQKMESVLMDFDKPIYPSDEKTLRAEFNLKNARRKLDEASNLVSTARAWIIDRDQNK